MSDDEKKQLALEAERLLRDDTLNRALDAMRAYGLEQLVQVPAEETHKVIKLQAYVAAVDAFRGQLGAYMAQGQQRKARGGLA